METRVRIIASPIFPHPPRIATLIQQAGQDNILEYHSGNYGKTRVVISGSDTSWGWVPIRK